MKGRSVRPRDASEQERRDVLDDSAMEVSAEELREFLEADLLGTQADPLFKEALRRKLWAMVREKYGPDRGH
jgi:hypothetical protein